MTDMVSTKRRSEIMALIKGSDTAPELMVRRVLHRLGYRFRLHVAALPGKPDIVLPKHKTVFQVQGCFWHGHSCEDGRHRPKSNMDYWNKKLDRNFARDKRNAQLLRQGGWRLVTIWACQCTKEAAVERVIARALKRA